MINRSTTFLGALLMLAVTVGCEKASPTRPSEVNGASVAPESVTDARTGATIVAPRPAAPANNAQIAYGQQPIALSVTNAVSTGASALTYTFEVAGDAAFARKVYTKENVAAGANGTTSQSIDKLGGSQAYYWRVQANAGSGAGPFSVVQTFTVGPEVVLGTPNLTSPINGAPGFSPLSLSINNISRTGPAGPIVYQADVAANDAFSNIIFTAEAAEQSGPNTTVTAVVNGLVPGATYFWRARATDTLNNITTPYSSPASFVAQSFNIRAAKFWDNPSDTGSWPVGAKITSIEFTGFSMRVDFDRRTGSNRWPDVIPPGWVGGLQYTLGICRNFSGDWHCSAVVQFWYGRTLDDTAPASRFWREWWYDSARWGPLASIRPVEGETMGVFVASGDLRQRFFSQASCPRVCEISNVAMVPFTSGYAKYEY
jgi:hypothetical protein